MPSKSSISVPEDSTVSLGFEASLWLTDKLRDNMEAAEYTHYSAPQGLAGFVLAKGRMSTHQLAREGDNRSTFEAL